MGLVPQQLTGPSVLVTTGGKSEPTGCKECGKDLEKVVKLSSTGADARSSPGPLTGYKETESVPPPSATEASPEGKQSSSSEGVMARGTGDRKIDAESPKIDHSHRPLTSHVKYLESNAKRHGGLRPLERAEARVGNLGPGAPEQHLSAVSNVFCAIQPWCANVSLFEHQFTC